MILVADGDHRAFSHIYDRFAGRLKGYFFKMLASDQKAAEDAVHDVFTALSAGIIGQGVGPYV